MPRPRSTLPAIALGAASLAPHAAFSQCPERWFPGGWRLGMAPEVKFTCVWDPDGPGPLPDLLVAAGDFHLAGGVPAQGIASWDGNAWRPIDTGLSGTVSGLAVYQGQLFASAYGGTSAPIFTFDGSSWNRLQGHDGHILGVQHGELIVRATVGSAEWLAWNGLVWRPITGTCGGDGIPGEYQGDLVSARFGDYEACVTRQTPAGWVSMNQGLLGAPQMGSTWALVSNGADLYAAGTFWVEGSGGVARCDGLRWRSMAAGGWATALHIYNGTLAAFGDLSTPAGPARVAFWNGADWSPVGPTEPPATYPIGTGALCTFRGDLVAAGKFRTLGGVPANSIARWSDGAWGPLGLGADMSAGGAVLAMHSRGAELIVGGVMESAAGTRCSAIARWTGTAWDAMAGGLTGTQYDRPSVRAITPYAGSIIAAGNFSRAGGHPMQNIAAWDGEVWHALGAGLGQSPGADQGVWALAEYQGALYAGGRGLIAPGQGLARWDGGTWAPVPGYSGEVHALAVYEGDLYVGDSGTIIPGGGRGLARWNGSQWLPVGAPGQAIDARALTVYNDKLIVGTTTTTFSQGVMAWDGQQWSTLGGGLLWGGQYGFARALAVVNGELFVGGKFVSAGNVPMNNVALWNGSTWRRLGTGVTGAPDIAVHAAVPYAGGLAVGGEFLYADGQLSPLLATWGRGARGCFANCDCSTSPPLLNVLDFNCFLNSFTTGDPYANCDHSTTPPILNVLDFNCYLNAFTAGCP